MLKTLQERLRYAREKKGFSQTEVGRRTGVNNKTLSGYENGVSEPDALTLSRLANLYDVTTDWLISGKKADVQPVEEDLDPELIEVMKEMSPEQQEHFRRYMRGEVEEPVFFTPLERQFQKDRQTMELDELLQHYTITIGGYTPTPEELADMIAYFKARRIMKMM